MKGLVKGLMKGLIKVIHPELRGMARFIWLVNRTFTIKRLKSINRIQQRKKQKTTLKGFLVEEVQIERANHSNFKTLIYKSAQQQQEKVPCFIWFHGGGYAIGTPDSTARIAQILMPIRPCVIVSPDYQLSIQAPYPAALNDAYATLQWVKQHADALGVDKSQIFVGGESAGGGLATALCLYARDMGDLSIAFQMPLYPMLDDRMNTHSAIDNHAPVWNSESNKNAWQLYLGDLYGTNEVPIYAAPSRAIDLANLPPAATFVGDLEPFYDEVVTYFNRLSSAGKHNSITAECKVFKGCYHAFEQISPKASVSQQAVAFMQEAYLKAVEQYRNPNVDVKRI